MAHLTFADLLVVFISIPIEIIWRFTVIWRAGLIACKVIQMLRVFGLYLSSFLIVSISIDRYYVFTKTIENTKKLNRILLLFSWTTAFIFSVPQYKTVMNNQKLKDIKSRPDYK
ncbi:G protein-coupled receptor-like protein [Leptotrombidium deliense]|uniref:G protein-coupled receptor-like protein n=1 Tax=Leptotrombidium deliense TaxID=299467 RepID=A0A443S5D4_9ACAR|nr:G protein-coupled receptor-like protein [Leptotrombidium deliense]